jgi:hypothetical protein
MFPSYYICSEDEGGDNDDYGNDPLTAFTLSLMKRRRTLEEEEDRRRQFQRQQLELQETENDRRRKLVVTVVAAYEIISASQRFTIENRLPNRQVDYSHVVHLINDLKRDPKTFTRMYRLSVRSFDLLLHIIKDDITPRAPGGKNIVPPIVKLSVTLRFMAGGSYLDLSFGYWIRRNVIHYYIMQVLEAIDSSQHPFINNIISPIYRSIEDLWKIEGGFAKMSFFKLRGTIAAGDGIILRMQRPSNEEAEGDVSSNYTRKNCYAYGLQVRSFFYLFISTSLTSF